ncbi:Allophanate hydrolase subunit 2 [Rhodospirillaceae bacterium LM-1]|nr:Allophanate hydrolase subunit 2 [Rhodospirillaceae bacterium LM-1]
MSLLVRHPGLTTSVQDLGRPGFLDLGIAPSGALDPELMAIANLLAGNQANAACLETLALGPVLTVEAESARIGLAGHFKPSIDGEPCSSWRSHTLFKGQTLKLGSVDRLRAGYVAVAGGFDLPPVMGSLAAYARAGLGVRLREGTVLPLHRPNSAPGPELFLPEPWPSPPHVLRVVWGPEERSFSAQAKQRFQESVWRVQAQSDRMGLRFDGPALEHRSRADIAPSGLVQGCIQVPGDGKPILLLADHQTTGGYARIAAVISADLAQAGRLTPGSDVAFKPIDWAQARQALIERRTYLQSLLNSIRPLQAIDLEALFAANLVSGMVDAKGQDDAS